MKVKDIFNKDNKLAVFNADGDLVTTGSFSRPRKAVDTACKAIVSSSCVRKTGISVVVETKAVRQPGRFDPRFKLLEAFPNRTLNWAQSARMFRREVETCNDYRCQPTGISNLADAFDELGRFGLYPWRPELFGVPRAASRISGRTMLILNICTPDCRVSKSSFRRVVRGPFPRS